MCKPFFYACLSRPEIGLHLPNRRRGVNVVHAAHRRRQNLFGFLRV
jgi:hypothetical protein